MLEDRLTEQQRKSTLSNEFELYKGDEIVMDHLSESQVIALSNIL